MSASVVASFFVAGCGGDGDDRREVPRDAFGPAPVGVEIGRPDLAQDGPIPVREVHFRVDRGASWRARGLLAVPPGGGRRPAVVYLHGLGADASDFFPEALLMAGRGVVALSVDSADARRRAAASRGVAALRAELAVRQRTVRAVRRAFALLARRRDVDPARLAFVGFSRGAATGALAAARGGPLAAEVYVGAGAGLSTWPGEPSVAGDPSARAVRNALDPATALAAAPAERPRLVQFGLLDEVIPPVALERFARAVPGRPAIERVAAAGHALDLAAMDRRLRWLGDRLDVGDGHVEGAPVSTDELR